LVNLEGFMEIRLSNSANKALIRMRDKFCSGNFEPSRKKTLNALLTVFSNDWSELSNNADWTTRHVPMHTITIRKDSSKLLNDLMGHLRQANIDIKEDLAINCMLDYADAKFDDPEFRDSLIEFFLGNAKDPSEEELLLIELPNQLHEKLKKVATKDKKKTTVESFVRDLLNDEIPDMKDSRLKDFTVEKKDLVKLKADQFTFGAIEVDPAIKRKLAENLKRSFGPSVVALIDHLITVGSGD